MRSQDGFFPEDAVAKRHLCSRLMYIHVGLRFSAVWNPERL